MRRSKLESCEAILGSLVKYPLTVDKIAYENDMDCTVLKRYLDLLIENGLVEERIFNRKKVYAATETGAVVFKTLNFQKYLERFAKSIRAIDDASQALPVISKRLKDEEKKDKD